MTDYTDAATLKARLWPTGTTPDASEDTIIASVITTASRMIDHYCGRSFAVPSEDSTRYFTAQDAEYLFPHVDIVSVTTLYTDSDGDRTYEDTWTATDFDLCPDNAAADGWPYTHIQVSPDGDYSFPLLRKGVKIIGKFGWPTATPDAIKEACVLQAERLFKRKDAPFGVISNPAGGDMRLLNKLDPDVEMMISPYRRLD